MIKIQKSTSKIYNTLQDIPESYCFLCVGHLIGSVMGEDRKNILLLLKAFYEIFKNEKKPPALILKTSRASSSHLDRREIQKLIYDIKSTVSGKNLPNVYLLHGDLHDSEMNELYNHYKVKAMVMLTKGEGFGRPLLEFSLTDKPIITTNWSGHIDFLDEKYTALIGGELKPIHPSSQVKDILVENSQWFAPDHQQIGTYLMDFFHNYKQWKERGKKQGQHSRTNFNFDKMTERLGGILDKNIPNFPKQVELKLPKLKKINLPKRKK